MANTKQKTAQWTYLRAVTFFKTTALIALNESSRAAFWWP